MKTLPFISLTMLAGCLVANPLQAMNSAAVDSVLKLKQAGLEDDAIVAFIKSKNVNYELSSDDLVLLKNQGMSSAVLTVMVTSGATQAVPSPSPAPPVIVPAPSALPPGPAPTPIPAVSPSPTLLPPGMNPDAAYFYQQLSPYGHWLLTEDNQWVWQPAAVVTSHTWQPYSDQGHWVYTDSGWYWASDYSWGWAPFHYGRWRLHPLHGWIWYPDRVWGPAWVTWRNSAEYCGWAPLPPGAIFDAAGVLIFNGRRVAVDFDFGLDWHHFTFCRLREMGEPHFARISRETNRQLAFGRTTVINHYTVTRTMVEGRNEVRVVNHGIEPARVAAIKGHNIETIRIQDMHSPPANRAHEHFDKDRKTLEVYRPRWGDHR